MWATQARMKPWRASHSLSARIASPAARLTSGSGFGSAVAMPPMGTAPRLSEIATSRRKMLLRNGVVLMSTPNRSGQTDLGSAITYSKMLALRSEEHTSELQSRGHLVCRLLLEKKKKNSTINMRFKIDNV